MRADLVLLAGSWLLTYLVHSTLLLGGIWLLSRRGATAPSVRDTLWKVGMVGALITSSLQVGLGLEPLGGALALGDHSSAVATVQPPVADQGCLERSAATDSAQADHHARSPSGPDPCHPRRCRIGAAGRVRSCLGRSCVAAQGVVHPGNRGNLGRDGWVAAGSLSAAAGPGDA